MASSMHIDDCQSFSQSVSDSNGRANTFLLGAAGDGGSL